MSKDVARKLEGLLEHVDEGRRGALKRLLLGTGVAALVAPVATLLAVEQDPPGEGRGKGKGKGKGKGDSPAPGEGRGKGKGRGKGDPPTPGEGRGKGKGRRGGGAGS